VLRTAPVMDRSAPPFKQLALLTRLGLGARLGDGRQRMPMISLRDWVGAVTHLAEHDVSGPANLCCPQTPTNGEFTDALARAVHRKAFLRVPRLGLEPAAGAMAPELLGSVNARPAVLEQAGYGFRDRSVHEVVRAALA
jgi:NAD dependent epimerase/dehydratase family enzyme